MSKRSHPEDISTNEPVSKKQAITPEMYEKLEVKIKELEKRNIDAQEMTQKQIEKFQDRTAKAEEKLSKINEIYKLIDDNETILKDKYDSLTCLRTDYNKKIGSANSLDIKICYEIKKLKFKITGIKNQMKKLVCPEILLPGSQTSGGSRGGGRGGGRGGRAFGRAITHGSATAAAFGLFS